MKLNTKALSAFDRGIGNLESWQNRYENGHDQEINEIKHRLMQLSDRMEREIADQLNIRKGK